MRLQGQFDSGVRPGASEPHSSPSEPGPFVSVRACRAVCLLLCAHRYAQQLGRPVWDFAVEIEDLRSAGLTKNDLRWLVCKGHVEHAQETTLAPEESRSFRRRGGLIFSRRTCFVLTDTGVAFVRQFRKKSRLGCSPQGVQSSKRAARNSPETLLPRWDRDRQELRLGSCLVKQFKVPAANQERILAAFEEEGWPVRIDDPLPPQPEQDPKRRLHDTINALNRKQRQRLIRFSGDGTGQGIRWAAVLSSSNGNGAGAAKR